MVQFQSSDFKMEAYKPEVGQRRNMRWFKGVKNTQFLKKILRIYSMSKIRDGIVTICEYVLEKDTFEK